VTDKISKPNHELDYLNSRLDEIGMSDYARLRAKASLARAEAMADAIEATASLVKRLAKTLVIRPYRRLMTSIG
jgi:hypothetical protein